MNVLPVEIWSDIACPWCWIGKRHLETAAAGLDIAIDLTWRSFELDPKAPDSPEEPVDYAARIAAKYGLPREQAQDMIDRISQAKTRVLGQRIKQLNGGATPFVSTEPSMIDNAIIAQMELEQRKIPFILRRPLPGGGSEFWRLKDLAVIG